MDLLRTGLQLGIPVAIVASLLLVLYLEPETGEWRTRLRSRLLFGLPVGTLTVILLVLAVYLFVQQGLWHRYAPLTLPFTSWSYLYPLGVITAPFAHQSLGHLTGNLIGFAALGPVVEYAVSHFPTERGAHTFGGWRRNPYVRAFLFVPGGVVLAGLLTSVFAWGPIIGFSGVVFAAAGFALVRYPMVTVVALVGREFLRTVYFTLRDPIVVESAGPSFGPPWWAGIAIQGHVLGFLIGILFAVLVFSARDEEGASPFRLWLGAVISGSFLTLWGVWWFQDASTYVLYRGPGLLMVLVLATAVVLAVRATDRTLVEGVTRRQAAIAVMTLPLLTMGLVAVPVNVSTLSEGGVPGDPIEVDGYQVTYAEDVPNQRIGAINISVLGETTQVNSSGVIVVNRERQIWDEAVSTGRLADAGSGSVVLGGIGWRETVEAERVGWRVAGGETAYVVALRKSGGEFATVFESDPAEASPVIAGRNVTVVPEAGTFELRVRRVNQTGSETRLDVRGPIPEANASVEIGGLTFDRNETLVYAVRNDTRVPIIQQETYR